MDPLGEAKELQEASFAARHATGTKQHSIYEGNDLMAHLQMLSRPASSPALKKERQSTSSPVLVTDTLLKSRMRPLPRQRVSPVKCLLQARRPPGSPSFSTSPVSQHAKLTRELLQAGAPNSEILQSQDVAQLRNVASRYKIPVGFEYEETLELHFRTPPERPTKAPRDCGGATSGVANVSRGAAAGRKPPSMLVSASGSSPSGAAPGVNPPQMVSVPHSPSDEKPHEARRAKWTQTPLEARPGTEPIFHKRTRNWGADPPSRPQSASLAASKPHSSSASVARSKTAFSSALRAAATAEPATAPAVPASSSQSALSAALGAATQAADGEKASIVEYLAKSASGRMEARESSNRLNDAAAARAESKGAPVLLETAPVWWKAIPEPVVNATKDFDKRHEALVERARRAHCMAQKDTVSIRKAEALRRGILEVKMNRYVAPVHRAAPIVVHKAAPRVKKVVEKPPLDLRTTIWGPRANWCDSKDFYDSMEVKQKRFALDWKSAIDSLGLSNLILRSDLDGEGAADEDGDGLAEEVEEVGAVLWSAADLVFRLFTYYASLGDDLFGLSFNEWLMFVDEQKLGDKRSKLCKKRDLERIFIAVDTVSERYWKDVRKSILEKEKAGKLKDEQGKAITASAMFKRHNENDKAKSLSRVEFTGALVHVAIAKYILSSELTDVSEAMERLLTKDIQPVPSVVLDPDQFRREYCYTEPVIEVLERHEVSLRNIFTGVAGGGGRVGLGASLISLDEWINFLEALECINVDLTQRDASFAFAWSRMAVINGRSERGNLRETSLPFEGFLEAVCRISLLKSLPTDEEIKGANQPHAFAYMEKLKVEEEERHMALLQARATKWGELPDSQPVHRCVEHMITYMVSKMEYDNAGADNLLLTEAEAVAWFKAKKLYRHT